MPRNVRGALLQASWTGDKESMIQKHEKAAHDAAKQGAQVMLFQELFYGPYFCQVQDPQYYSYTELIPDGPTTKRMQDLAKQTGMVLVVPMYEEDEQASGTLSPEHRKLAALILSCRGYVIIKDALTPEFIGASSGTISVSGIHMVRILSVSSGMK